MSSTVNHRNAHLSARRPALLALAAAAFAGALAPQALAQHDYEVKHTFDIKTPGNLAPHLALKHEEYAYARCRKAKDKKHKQAIDVLAAVGKKTFTQTATAGTVSVANSEIDVTTLVVGAADGTIRVFGDVDLCPAPASAYGRAVSACKLYYRGKGMDRRGRIGWVGSWRAEPGIKGGAGKVRRVDPIVARIIDKTTGEVREYLMLDIWNFVQGGWAEWRDDVLTNRAPTMEFEIVVPGDVTKQKGRLRIAAEFGVITEVVAEGVFAGLGAPAVGDAARFDMKLPSEIVLDYDLGGDETHELEVEIDAGGAGEHEEAQGEIAGDLYIHDDIGTAYEGADPVVLEPRSWLPGEYGVPLMGDMSRAAVPIGPLTDVAQLDRAIIRLAHPEAPLDASIEGLGAVLWAGPPGAGVPVAGDPTAPIALETAFANSYAVFPGALLDNSVPIKDVTLDMSWAPPLEPGVDYWLELFFNPGSDPFIPWWPLNPYHADGSRPTEQPALAFDGRQWRPLQDPATGRCYMLPFMVFGAGDSGGCYADCDSSGTLDIFDFLCFQNAFGAGESSADCDGDGSLDIFDFLCFQNEFAAGCP
ncbi:MAG: GC-type dockerin domain-anchored protein [Phycisphaerales bacterium JB039]